MRRAVNQSCLAEADLMPGDASFFRVFFRPDANAGPHTATLEFTHDATSAPSPYRVTLVGEAEIHDPDSLSEPDSFSLPATGGGR